MAVFIAGFAVGAFIAFLVIGLIATFSNFGMFARRCSNCVHAHPAFSKDRQVRVYCDLVPNGVEDYPVHPEACCGKFELTEELKAEQVRIKAEKMVGKS